MIPLTNKGIFYQYQIYDLEEEKFVSDIYDVFRDQGDFIILENENQKVIFSTNNGVKKIKYFKQSKALLPVYLPYQISIDTYAEKSDLNIDCQKNAGIQLLIDTLNILPLDQIREGYKVVIQNCSGDKKFISSQDTRIYLGTEVYINDEWKPIENFLSSWCGNSYFDIEFENSSAWEFVVPKYSGDTNASFRVHFYTFDNEGQKLSFYSDTFNGSFNLSQLFVNENGVMNE